MGHCGHTTGAKAGTASLFKAGTHGGGEVAPSSRVPVGRRKVKEAPLALEERLKVIGSSGIRKDAGFSGTNSGPRTLAAWHLLQQQIGANVLGLRNSRYI